MPVRRRPPPDGKPQFARLIQVEQINAAETAFPAHRTRKRITPGSRPKVSKARAAEDMRAVLENVAHCERDMGYVVVGVSLKKTGGFPHYRVSPSLTGKRMKPRCFSGRTHKPLTADQERKAVWSKEEITGREFRNFSKRLLTLKR